MISCLTFRKSEIHFLPLWNKAIEVTFKKQQLKPDTEQLIISKLGKEYDKAIHCHSAYFYAEYIMQNSGLDESQAGIKIARRNINNLRYADDITLMAES